MRHAAPRPRAASRGGRRPRRVRLAAVVVSGLTVATSVLGAAGVLGLPETPAGDALVIGAGFELDGSAEDTEPGGRDSGARAADARRAAVDDPAGDDSAGDDPASEEAAAAASAAKSRSTGPGAPRADASAPADPAKPESTSPFDARPPLPADSGDGKRVVFSITDQRVWLVGGDDEIQRSYPVSGSRFDQLEPGSYDVIRKRRHTTSWHGTESMEYMVTFTFGENAAIGFHDIPVSLETGEPIQTVRQLGTPLSDGCVRQRHADAAALWTFAPEGTPVIVTP